MKNLTKERDQLGVVLGFILIITMMWHKACCVAIRGPEAKLVLPESVRGPAPAPAKAMPPPVPMPPQTLCHIQCMPICMRLPRPTLPQCEVACGALCLQAESYVRGYGFIPE